MGSRSSTDAPGGGSLSAGQSNAFELDRASAASFAVDVGPLFEHAPGFLERLAAARPFGSLARMFELARDIAHAMPEELQIELVDAHPRLGAPPASVSQMSFREQGYDEETASGLADEAATEGERVAAELDRLNRAYENHFGFRYCVFVAGRSRAALLPEMAASLSRERGGELHRAIDAVIDIAEARSNG